MRPRISLAFYWWSMVNQWHLEVGHSRWQWGSAQRSRRNFFAPVLGVQRNHLYVFGKKVILRTAFVATSAVWLRDTLQAYERYADSQHFVKRLHKGLWAFPPRSRGRTPTYLSLPSRQLIQGHPDRERDDLSLSASELEKHNLGRLPCCKS